MNAENIPVFLTGSFPITGRLGSRASGSREKLSLKWETCVTWNTIALYNAVPKNPLGLLPFFSLLVVYQNGKHFYEQGD